MFSTILHSVIGLSAICIINLTCRCIKYTRLAKQINLPYMFFPFSEHSVLYLGVVESGWYRTLVDNWFPAWLVDYANNSSFKYRWRVKDRICKEHGSVYTIVTPDSVTCHISDAAVATQVCMARQSFPKPVENYKAFAIYGPSILTSEGTQWAHYRRCTTTTFNEKNNALVWRESIRQALQMTAYWAEQYDADSPYPKFIIPDMRDNIVKFTLNIICSAGFGVTLPFRPTSQAAHSDAESLLQDASSAPPGYHFTFGGVMEYISNYMTTIFLANGLLPRWVPRQLVPFFKMDFTAYDDLKGYMNSLLANAEARETPSSHNLLEGLVKARRNNSEEKVESTTNNAGLSDDEILGNLYIFMIAGHETTATTLRFALVLLATHQQFQNKLYNEIKGVARDEPDDIALWDYQRAFAKLITPLCIMLEVLRLYPAVSSLPKWTSDKRATLFYAGQQYHIPASTHISIDANALHYSEEYWGPNVADFDPSRWDKRNKDSFLAQNDGMEGLSGPGLEYDSIHRPARGSFMPFSDGVRACVGKKFAQVEFVAALVVIFREYRVSLAKIDPSESEEQMRHRVDQVLQGSSNYQTLTMRQQVPLLFEKRAPDSEF